MPTLADLTLPNIDPANFGEKDAKKLLSHMFQLEEQLRYVLGNLDEENIGKELLNKIESGGMSSEVSQTLEGFQIRVSGLDDALAELGLTVDGVSSTVQAQGGSISTLQQTATQLRSDVEDLTGSYSTLEQTAQRMELALGTQDEQLTKMELTVDGMKFEVTDGENSTTLTLKAGEAVLASAEITFKGLVTFKDLSEPGRTEINGGNLTTGVVQNKFGTTIYDLDNGTIQMGATDEPHILIDDKAISWYINGGRTGIFYSTWGASWIGATSIDTYYGWIGGDTPGVGDANRTNGYHGLRITHRTFEDGIAHFNTTGVECGGDFVGGNGSFSAKYIRVDGQDITNAASQVMTVATKDYGDIVLTAPGSASPIALDNGSGVLDETGRCYLFLSDEFAATVSANVTPQWHITPTCETEKPLTVKKEGLYAVVRGEPGTTFDWLCILPQKGCETLYCEPVEMDLSNEMARKDYVSADELDAVAGFEQSLNDEVLTVLKENSYIEEIWPEQLERRA